MNFIASFVKQIHPLPQDSRNKLYVFLDQLNIFHILYYLISLHSVSLYTIVLLFSCPRPGDNTGG